MGNEGFAVAAGILMLLISAAAVGSTVVYRHRVGAMLDRIRQRLVLAARGDYTAVSYDESMEAAIGEETNRLLGLLEDQQKKQHHETGVMQQFLADISHQIKTPLSNIMVYSELVSGSPNLSKEERELLELVCRQSEKLDFLVSTLIKASRMELEMIQVHPVTGSLDALILSCCKEKAHEAEKKKINLQIEPCGAVCPFDFGWMEEALGNLIDNALKYSPCGSRVGVFVTEYGFFWCIHVRDHGVGIRESEQGLIFQRFYRSECARSEPGLGIGLYLSREIVRQHGGYIEVRSKEGEGAEFRMYLPRQ